MKLRCERDVLVDALGTAGRAVAGRSGALPVLSGVRLEVTGDHLTVTGTDLDLTITVSSMVNGSVDGVVVAPGRLVTDIVRALEPGAVTLETGDSESGDEDLRITAGRSAFTVRTHPAGDFPRLASPSGDAVTLPAEGLSEALRQVVRAASGEDSRPILTGVLMAAEAGGLRLVATDSYRLAVRDLPGAGAVLSEGQKVLVPSRALGELQRLLGSAAGGDVELRLGQHDATFGTGSVALTSRLIEGEFPNYRQLIPASYPNRLVVGREALLDAVRRVKLLARDATTPVRIALRPDGIELTVITTDWGTATEDVDAKYEGAEMTVAFNPAYLIDGVEAVPTDEVVLDTLDALKPATLRPTDSDDYLYLLMPVRVS
ncbi:DNA polymerase III subunit beta [Acidiferrimicrobium sp. IK]|uniref:DNA polymerase III subunit beta n=1 Tax=Acidiferrimicrobium sp. IK TaxID=2871700 RepID=UPI0021CB618D|nr:DNA polymerase III subunit beta [Acidiferrimicrobium sp. IK]MCU4187101.1 DNA polymerase III subunit beta [Acidiferrimicrobium sp. IK]